MHRYNDGNDRSSRQEVFSKKDILENFKRFTGKHVRRSLFIIKLWRLWRTCFLVNFAEFSTTIVLWNSSGCLTSETRNHVQLLLLFKSEQFWKKVFLTSSALTCFFNVCKQTKNSTPYYVKNWKLLFLLSYTRKTK